MGRCRCCPSGRRCIAGGIGGAIGGFFNAVSWSYCIPGIAVIPVFFKTGHMPQFLGFVLSIVVAFVLGVLITWLVGFKDETDSAKAPAAKTSKAQAALKQA